METKILVQQWKSCQLEKIGRVYILTLTGNNDHRFNPASIDDIMAALKTIEQSPDAGALITTNEGRFFSNGIDLKWIQKNLSSSTVNLIRDKFECLLCFMMKLGIPTIAAICGHGAAGGFMLALAHDYRFMKNGKAILYMSELDHGMYMPRSLMSVIRSKLLPASLREVLLKARKFTASEAFEFGFVDGVYDDSGKTLEAAIIEAEKLARRNWKRYSYANLRAGAFPGVVEELEAHRDPYIWTMGSKL
ncbi:enoyl-CoA delta isomerase 2, peroxisomal-like [Tasmannia lanceolata]|uniref:enoyl-CoA delta isomerase 2, peroxisomal-like n=1 Tax=Tasmannia lanceolata TaxID=3420 RepID=UPI0040639214